MERQSVGPQVYVALALAAAAAVLTMPRDGGAAYREFGWHILQDVALAAHAEDGTMEQERFVAR